MEDELKAQLAKHYSTEEWKSALSRDLGIDVATVRRWFNQDGITVLGRWAVQGILSVKRKRIGPGGINQ